jgi:cytidylate kinase
MVASVICVSHTEGAGGREIGRLLADRLGFRYADDEIVVTAARANGYNPEAVALAESRRTGRRVEVDFGRSESTEELRDLICAAIVTTADEGSVVIVAHAASQALAYHPGVLRVLVTASDDTRARRVADAEDVDAKTAARIVRESDKGRAVYLKRFYAVDPELPTHYDLVVNTDVLAPESVVGAIARAAGELAVASSTPARVDAQAIVTPRHGRSHENE